MFKKPQNLRWSSGAGLLSWSQDGGTDIREMEELWDRLSHGFFTQTLLFLMIMEELRSREGLSHLLKFLFVGMKSVENPNKGI